MESFKIKCSKYEAKISGKVASNLEATTNAGTHNNRDNTRVMASIPTTSGKTSSGKETVFPQGYLARHDALPEYNGLTPDNPGTSTWGVRRMAAAIDPTHPVAVA